MFVEKFIFFEKPQCAVFTAHNERHPVFSWTGSATPDPHPKLKITYNFKFSFGDGSESVDPQPSRENASIHSFSYRTSQYFFRSDPQHRIHTREFIKQADWFPYIKILPYPRQHAGTSQQLLCGASLNHVQPTSGNNSLKKDYQLPNQNIQ
jgi:hypothetical protein